MSNVNSRGATPPLSSSPSHPMAVAVTPQDEHFFKALGSRIAELRKEQGLSQQALAVLARPFALPTRPTALSRATARDPSHLQLVD
jgi:hypothetical protein